MEISKRAFQAYDYLVRKHKVPPVAAAGIVGNLAAESGNFDSANPKDLATQLDFIVENLPGQILSAASPQEASDLFKKHYGRPSKDRKPNHQDRRNDYVSRIAGTLSPVAPATPLGAAQGHETSNVLFDFGQSLEDEPRSGTSHQARGPGDVLINLGRSLVGEATQDGTYDVSYHGYAPNDVTPGPGYQLGLGRSEALHQSTQSKFGLLPTGEHVSLDGIDDDVIMAATAAANYLGRDIPVTSGYRSQARQDQIRRGRSTPLVAKRSKHTDGKALDIRIADMDDREVADLVEALIASGFTGFGYYGPNSHVHADFRSSVPRSFDSGRGWGGWTSIPPFMMERMMARGFRPGASSASIRRGF